MCYGTNTKYITDFHSALPSAATTATSYVSATLKQRLATIQDINIFPGIYILNTHKHIKPIFFPQVVQIPGSPNMDMNQDVLLVHGSKDPLSFRPELIPVDMVKWALVLIPSTTSTTS